MSNEREDEQHFGGLLNMTKVMAGPQFRKEA
jgi:hypothetical protein